LARYRASRALFIQPQDECLRTIAADEVFTMADDAPASLDWIALDVAAEAAIAAEQERYSQMRGGSTLFSPWGCALAGDSQPPAENWPPPNQRQPVTSRSWPPRSRLARHNRNR
jgi:hypothetical protein